MDDVKFPKGVNLTIPLDSILNLSLTGWLRLSPAPIDMAPFPIFGLKSGL